MFGSAVTGRYDHATSDLDFLVGFRADAPKGTTPFFGLKDALEKIVGHEVDLVEAAAVRNPYFARRAFGEAVDVHAA